MGNTVAQVFSSGSNDQVEALQKDTGLTENTAKTVLKRFAFLFSRFLFRASFTVRAQLEEASSERSSDASRVQ